MAILKEPEGVTFTVINKPLTDEDRKLISEYIAKSKRKSQTAAVSGKHKTVMKIKKKKVSAL